MDSTSFVGWDSGLYEKRKKKELYTALVTLCFLTADAVCATPSNTCGQVFPAAMDHRMSNILNRYSVQTKVTSTLLISESKKTITH